MTGLSRRVGKVPPTPCVWYLLLHMFGITPPSRNSVSFSMYMCFSSFIRGACAPAPLHPTCILLRASNAPLSKTPVTTSWCSTILQVWHLCSTAAWVEPQVSWGHGTLWVYLLVFACIWEASDMLGRVPCPGSPPKLRIGRRPNK